MDFDIDARYNILDSATPRHTALSGRYKRSFAYLTLNERLPVILTEILDNLTRNKDLIAAKHDGEKTLEEIKVIVGQISKLKYQLQTDKCFEKFEGQEADKDTWNNFLGKLNSNSNSFYQSSWLVAECYMYRKVASFFENSQTLKKYDYFSELKKNSLEDNHILCVSKALRHTDTNLETFTRILKLSLWGNKCDLSIVVAKNFDKSDNVFEKCEKLNSKILIDDSKTIWKCLMSANRLKPVVVDFVLDNAGFELFTDLVLAHYLITKQIANKIRFHVKAIPWFVSDTTASDFETTLEYLCKHSSQYVSELGQKLKQNYTDGSFEIARLDHFWTSPIEYYKMRELYPDLYKYLGEANLVIFKGDLNYRKLLGDMNWDTTDDFLTCLRGFQPTNLCVLRTIKADLLCGLEQGEAETLTRQDPRWMVTGEYGVIQFMEGNACKCHHITPAVPE